MKEMPDLKESIEILEGNHQELLAKTDQLYDAVTKLRYEGKVNLGHNIHDVEKVVSFFEEKLIPHMKLEDTVFTFMEKHVPKLESIIRILQAEHREIKVNLEVVVFLLKEIADEKNDLKRTQDIEKLKDKSTYLIYLLRTHIQAEDESIYKSLDEKLRAEEKKELLKKISELSEWKSLTG